MQGLQKLMSKGLSSAARGLGDDFAEGERGEPEEGSCEETEIQVKRDENYKELCKKENY